MTANTKEHDIRQDHIIKYFNYRRCEQVFIQHHNTNGHTALRPGPRSGSRK